MTEVWGHCSGTCDIIGCLWKKQLISNKCCCTSRREFVPRAAGSTDTHISACRTRKALCIYTYNKTNPFYVAYFDFKYVPACPECRAHVIDGSRWEWQPERGWFLWKASSMKSLVLPLEHPFVFLMRSWTLKWKTANDVLLHNTSSQRDS